MDKVARQHHGAHARLLRVGYDAAMLLTLQILKIVPGSYRAHVMEGREHLGDYDASNVAEAIRLAAENPLPDLAGFHVWYEHICAGSVSAGEMRGESEALAERLIELHSKFRNFDAGGV